MLTRLVIADRAYKMLAKDCQRYADIETGGVLAGVVHERICIVPFVIPAGRRAQRTRSSFRPDCAWQQRCLDFVWERFGANYRGDYHKHPAEHDEPSARDLATARRIVTSPKWDVEQAVFPIAVVRNGEVYVRAFAISRSKHEFTEITIDIVPDQDSWVVRALTGTLRR